MDVTGLDHLGQLGQLDAGRLGQHLAFVGGQPGAVVDQVAGQLGGSPVPNGPMGTTRELKASKTGSTAR